MRNHGYFIQIGFDFGTSYCKCVCRDIIQQKAWVYCPVKQRDGLLPFLIPSALQVSGNKLKIGEPSAHYHNQGLPHIKIALVKVAKGEWDDQALRPYKQLFPQAKQEELKRLVVACGIYLLAGALGDIRASIKLRYPDFGTHKDDYMAVNLAIPVADAQSPEVDAMFQHVLNCSWRHADELAGHPAYTVANLCKYLPGKEIGGSQTPDACFIYPEVSAGVQSFAMSQNSKAGTYIFTDTGAGTVDQSVFILSRHNDDGRKLVYLHAMVNHFGSSYLERTAAELAGETGWQSLEAWRAQKETLTSSIELKKARDQVYSALKADTVNLLFIARKKLPIPDQLDEPRVMFGGGGHSTNPYENAVTDALEDQRILGRPLKWTDIKLPALDMENMPPGSGWTNRLSVACGLSYQKDELVKYIYPKDIPVLTAKERRPKSRSLPQEIGKEHC